MNRVFKAVFSLRYLAIIAVVGPFLGAVLMLLIGGIDVINAYLTFFSGEEPGGASATTDIVLITLVASLDHFLFAVVLMIFGLGLSALFFNIGRDRNDETAHGKRLTWKHVKNLGGMDEMLLKVIIMLLAVSFLEFVLRVGMDALSWTALVIPAAIVGLGLSLRWMSAAAEEDEENELRHESMRANKESRLTELERLAMLREQGYLEEEEFSQMKARLLSP